MKNLTSKIPSNMARLKKVASEILAQDSTLWSVDLKPHRFNLPFKGLVSVDRESKVTFKNRFGKVTFK